LRGRRVLVGIQFDGNELRFDGSSHARLIEYVSFESHARAAAWRPEVNQQQPLGFLCYNFGRLEVLVPMDGILLGRGRRDKQ
jgi:hypothetical protein